MRSAAVASVFFLLVGFVAGLLGQVGSLHHAAHVVAGVLVAELVLWAIFIFLDGTFD